jgi:hypothetical protein
LAENVSKLFFKSEINVSAEDLVSKKILTDSAKLSQSPEKILEVIKILSGAEIIPIDCVFNQIGGLEGQAKLLSIILEKL